jgi:hypothetical protein
MRSPSEYFTEAFGAMHVMEVDPGTVITDERSGEKITVTDDTVAVKGRVMFCTKAVYDRLKQEVPTYGNA